MSCPDCGAPRLHSIATAAKMLGVGPATIRKHVGVAVQKVNVEMVKATLIAAGKIEP